MHLYKLQCSKFNKRIIGYKIIRETRLSWFVGHFVGVRGGYINKKSKKYFTDIKVAYAKLKIELAQNIKDLSDLLLKQQMTHDLIEEEDWARLEVGDIILRMDW